MLPYSTSPLNRAPRPAQSLVISAFLKGSVLGKQ